MNCHTAHVFAKYTKRQPLVLLMDGKVPVQLHKYIRLFHNHNDLNLGHRNLLETESPEVKCLKRSNMLGFQ